MVCLVDRVNIITYGILTGVLLNILAVYDQHKMVAWRVFLGVMALNEILSCIKSYPHYFSEPHRRHCIVSLSKNINPSLVLVQPRKTCPFITERLLMGRKESNQTNKHYFSATTVWFSKKFLGTFSIKSRCLYPQHVMF